MTFTCTDADEAPATRMVDCDQILSFILAGNAYLTLRSKKTGTRYTYRIRHKEDVAFVSCLYGSQNTDDYAYLGIIKDGQFRVTAKSRFNEDSPQAKAFAWSFNQVMGADRIPDTLEFWHEGRCGRCGRLLTVPESIAIGIGPECLKKGASHV